MVWRLDENKSAEVSLAPKDTILMGKIPQSEKRALAFYIDRVSPVFSAYFGKSFWSSIVLQLSHENNLVRSALLCASSLFQSFELPANSAVSQREFYHSYSLAMKSLRDADSRPSTEIVLTACLLFTSYEFILGSFSQGLVHHRSGFKIAESRIQQLREERRLDTPEASFLLTHIKPILNDYALQAAAYGAVTFPTQEQVITPNERHELPYTPKSFPSLHVAHHCLSGIVHHITISEATLDGPWDTVMARQVRECLDQWPLSLMEYARTRGRSSIELEKRQLVFLDCNHQLATLLFEELVSKDATEADVGIQRKASSYRGIISRFQEVEQDDKATREAPGLDNYIEGIIPLFVIAVTAEDKQVRSEALSLLGSMKRKEANWDSEQAFKIAQVIIQLERRALSKKDVDFKDTSRSDIQAIFRNDTLPCLHTSSVQWVSQVMCTIMKLADAKHSPSDVFYLCSARA